MKVIWTIWTMNYIVGVPFSCIYSFCVFHNRANFKKSFRKYDQTYINLTLLSIFLFLIYLFICLNNISIYILMIYKWFKIRAQVAFWLNINEIQTSEYIVKNHNPIFLDSDLLFKFCSSRRVWNNIYKSYCLYISCVISHIYGVLMIFNLDFKGPDHTINMCCGNALVVCDWYGYFWILGTFQSEGLSCSQVFLD